MAVTHHETLDLLILGDSGVGKSTLINCYLTRRFTQIPSGVLKSKIQLPGTEYGCKSVNVNLCDTRACGVNGNNNAWNENLEKCIMDSSAILIVGSWDNEQSINRIENHWLPSVTKLCESQSIPILILINKSDLLGDLENIDFMNQQHRASLCHQLQSRYMVKHVFQTSCVEIKSVITAFDTAIQLIIYPIQQLIITENDYCFKSLQKTAEYPYYREISKVKRKTKHHHHQQYKPAANVAQIITKRFLLALKRIFHLMDRDNDTLLTDYDVLYYYRQCLTLHSMRDSQVQRLRKLLLAASQSNVTEDHEEKYHSFEEGTKLKPIRVQYVKNDCFTFEGFIQIHLILIQIHKHYSVWKSLERFGYTRKDLRIAPNVYPCIPSKTHSFEFCERHNPFLRPSLKTLMDKHSKTKRQYELSPSIAGFLMSIFIRCCENPHDEYNDYYDTPRTMSASSIIHEYSTCYVTPRGLQQLLEQYNIHKLPFELADFELVGCIPSATPSKSKRKTQHKKHGNVSLPAWISLWSLLMCYETETALKYLVTMGAPTLYPIHDFTPKWTDYLVPQIACTSNPHQRVFNCLVVTYPYNQRLLHQFIRSSVNDFSRCNVVSPPQSQSAEYPTPQYMDADDNEEEDTSSSLQPPSRKSTRRRKIPAASRTGSLSPIKEVSFDELHAFSAANTPPPEFALSAHRETDQIYQDDSKYQDEKEKYQYEHNMDPDEKESEEEEEKISRDETEQSVQGLNTMFCLKPQHKGLGEKMSYGALVDNEHYVRFVYEQYGAYLCKHSNSRRKPLIQLNLLNKDRGIDAYHTLLESWPQHAHKEESGQGELFQFHALCKQEGDGYIDKKVSKHLRKFDAVVYLHTVDALEHTENIKRLYNICRDQEMPIIAVTIPSAVTPKTGTNPEKHTKTSDSKRTPTVDIDPAALSAPDTNTNIITGQGSTSTIGTSIRNTDAVDLNEQSEKQLMQILEYYDLSRNRVLEWTSFAEDQSRFSYDLIATMQDRPLFIPKTLWQIRKSNALRYAKRGSVLIFGTGLWWYLRSRETVTKYVELRHSDARKSGRTTQPKMPNVELKEMPAPSSSTPVTAKQAQQTQELQRRPPAHTKSTQQLQSNEERKKRKEKHNESANQQRWKLFITVAVLTSVFSGGYYVYGKYRYRQNGTWNKNHKQSNVNAKEEAEEDEDEEKQSILSYLMSFVIPRFDDTEEEDEEDEDDLSFASFGFSQSKKSHSH